MFAKPRHMIAAVQSAVDGGNAPALQLLRPYFDPNGNGPLLCSRVLGPLARRADLVGLGLLAATQPPFTTLADATVMAEAAGAGHAPVVEWLRALDPPCPWGEDVPARAALGGHTALLDWLALQGCMGCGDSVHDAHRWRVQPEFDSGDSDSSSDSDDSSDSDSDSSDDSSGSGGSDSS